MIRPESLCLPMTSLERTFGNRYRELSLNDASEEWIKIKVWSKTTGQKVKRYKENEQLKVDKEQKT